jgi:polar amino acid transport system substrate-binding protein
MFGRFFYSNMISKGGTKMGTFKKLGVYFLVLAAFLTSASFVTAETTMERIRRTGVLRMAGQAGGEPYWIKNLTTGEWSGFAVEFGKDLAKELGVKLEVVESGFGQSILDLQANKIDVSFCLSPTPKRALVVEFTRPLYFLSHGVIVRPGFKEVKTWEDLNNPKVRIAADIGSTHETFARRNAPKANIVAYKTLDDVVMAMLGKKVDVISTTLILGLKSVAKNPSLGKFIIPKPVAGGPVCAAVQREEDKTFRDFVSIWADYNRGLGNIQEWMLKALYETGVKPSDVPRDLQF